MTVFCGPTNAQINMYEAAPLRAKVDMVKGKVKEILISENY